MKGICFIPPLHGKTVKKIMVQTRRILSHEDYINAENVILSTTHSNQMAHFRSAGSSEDFAGIVARYKVGEILYLKEPYCIGVNGCDTLPSLIYYKYNEKDMLFLTRTGLINDIKWKNKLFMPASDARHFIKITSVRPERLQDISDEDCIKEGIVLAKRSGFVPGGMAYDVSEEWNYTYSCPAWTPREVYAHLIDDINGKGTWESNPWVWVYDYTLCNREGVEI